MKTDNIIIFTKSGVYLYLPKDTKFKRGGLYCEYTVSSIPEILAKIRKDTGIHHFGILLNNEISYVIAIQITVPPKLEGMRNLIATHIPEKIPAMSENLVWDYKIVKEGSPENVQVAGVDKEFVESITNSIDKANLKIDFIEPLCYSFSKIPKSINQYFLIYNSNFEKIIAFVKNGIIVNCQNIIEKPAEGIKTFVDFIRTKYDISSGCGFYIDDQSKALSDSDLAIFTDLGLKAEVRDLTEIIFADPIDLKSKKDENSLNLSNVGLIKHHFFEKNIKSPETNVNTHPTGKMGRMKRPLILGAILVLLLIVGVIFVLNYLRVNNIIQIPLIPQKDKPEVVVEAEPVVEETILDSEPEETPIENIKMDNFKGFKVEILNGSGTKGEADKIKELLIPLEFDEIVTGNASSYNYQETEVSFKSNDLYRGIELIDTSISSYSILFSETLLPENYPYDVKIIVGKLKSNSDGFEE